MAQDSVIRLKGSHHDYKTSAFCILEQSEVSSLHAQRPSGQLRGHSGCRYHTSTSHSPACTDHVPFVRVFSRSVSNFQLRQSTEIVWKSRCRTHMSTAIPSLPPPASRCPPYIRPPQLPSSRPPSPHATHHSLLLSWSSPTGQIW